MAYMILANLDLVLVWIFSLKVLTGAVSLGLLLHSLSVNELGTALSEGLTWNHNHLIAIHKHLIHHGM